MHKCLVQRRKQAFRERRRVIILQTFMHNVLHEVQVHATLKVHTFNTTLSFANDKGIEHLYYVQFLYNMYPVYCINGLIINCNIYKRLKQTFESNSWPKLIRFIIPPKSTAHCCPAPHTFIFTEAKSPH